MLKKIYSWSATLSVLTAALSICIVTSAVAAPSFTAISPSSDATGVSVTSSVSATFSEAMDPLTLNSSSVMLAPYVGIKALAAGTSHTLALKNDGTVIAWGANSSNQTSVPGGLSGVIAIAAGESHSVALKNDGTVIAWGSNSYGQTNVPAGLSGVTSIAAGFAHTLALKSDGSVIAWGYDASGQTTLPSGLQDVKAIAAGYFHSLALKYDGTMIAWGNNDSGQTGIPTNTGVIKAIAAGWYHSVAVREDGTVIAWGKNEDGQTRVPAGLIGVATVAAGGYHSLALKSDGSMAAWGYNGYGQTSVPAGLASISAISAGGYYSAALRNDGTATAWGRNNYGQATVQGSICLGTPLPGTVSYDSGTTTVNLTPASPLPFNTTLTALVSTGVRSQAGANLDSDFFWYFTTDTPRYLLSVAINGSGGGSVHGEGIACADGSSTGCSNTYPGGSRVDLTAAPNWKSSLLSWSGDCSGSDPENCSPSMSRDRAVTATFNLKSQTMLDGNPLTVFATLQEAYQAAADGTVISAQADAVFYENLIINQSKSVSLDGGKDTNQITVGATTIDGSLTISDGTAIIGNFIIR